MKGNIFYARAFLCLLVFFLCQQQLNAITKVDEERIRLGMSAAHSAAKAMKAMEFVSWISKIGTVVSPILTVAIIAIDIIFSFLGIESPEMILMKAEFKNLNNRLDEFSVQFQEVKKKIDWSAIQLNYEKHESTIRVLTEERMRITDAKSEKQRNDSVETFIRKYENDFQMASEKLYHAMSTESILSDNIFEAARKYTDQHPPNSFQFMKGCTQLLVQSFAIQASYIHLKYNNTDADDYFKKLSTEKMSQVGKKADETYWAMVHDFMNQLKADVPRLALTNRNVGHKDFSQKLFNYFRSKYNRRVWFVHSYNEVSGFEKHAMMMCGGGLFFRVGGKNVVVASIDRNWAHRGSTWSVKWAKDVLNSFGEFRQDHNGAKGVLDRVVAKSNKCHPAAAVSVTGHGADGYYITEYNRAVQQQKSVKWCNTDLCWVWKIRYYATIIFG